jgi:hypothetical protein
LDHRSPRTFTSDPMIRTARPTWQWVEVPIL